MRRTTPLRVTAGTHSVRLPQSGEGTSHPFGRSNTLERVERSSHVYRSEMRMRFHPKRRASTDHTPGPRSASAAPRMPMRTHVHGFVRCKAACKNARIASIVPAIGVHKPIRRSTPIPMATTCSKAAPSGGAPRNSRTPWATKPIPAARRSKRRPSPGAPPAKFEKSRRKSWRGYKVHNSGSKPQRAKQSTLSSAGF